MARSKLNHRCSICNQVSSREIETNALEFSDKAFVPDPNNRDHFICQDCSDEVQEQLHYWDIKDFKEERNRKWDHTNDNGELPVLDEE